MPVHWNKQHRELKLPECARFALITAVMGTVSISGPTGWPVSPPLLSSQNIQSRENSSASHRTRGEIPTMSLALGANYEGKERVKREASRIKSSRTGFALASVRCPWALVLSMMRRSY